MKKRAKATVYLSPISSRKHPVKNFKINANACKKINMTDSFLRLFMNRSSDGIIVTDCEGRVLDVNDSFEKMHGWTRGEVCGLVLPMVPPHLQHEAEKLQNKLKSGESVTGYGTMKLRKDGSMSHANITIYPIRDAEGNIERFVGVERDITESKLAEQKLRESEERYRQLVELSPEPIIVHSDYRIVFVNPAAVKLAGAADQAELIGKEIFGFIHPTDLDTLESKLQQLFKEGKPARNIQKKLVRLDGQMIDIEISALPLEYMGKRSVQLLCKDISEQKKAEEELFERELQFRRMIKLLPEPMVIHKDGKIHYVNDMTLALVGAQSQEEVIGRSIFDFIHPDYAGVVTERIRLAITSNEKLDYMEIKLVRLDGTFVDVETSSIYIHKYLQFPVVQTVIRDLTDRKRTEEYMLRSEKLSVVGQLAAGVAHEIRNPLTSLKGFVQLMKTNKGNEQKYIEIMLSELDRIHSIVNEFMILAKPHEIHFQESSIVELIRNVVFLLDSQAILNNVQIHYDFEPDIPLVQCDENQMKQVFVNLLKNAIEAMPNGGTVQICVRTASNGNISIRIIDEGKGIPEDMIRKLGEPFFSTKETGTGLGLMICFGIVQAHNGTLRFSSKENCGTTVEVQIPCVIS
ncbi:PAS domain S-box protein [Ferviditalea candida]|uniref:histidine kinase n=1 Tax=Ferviditalea candida TaxID=3108399 RepID=A0ABU5ZMC4_9BACL|nr:PAS domain S-box protein [Paenibacillaceae bacterium T2]